MWLFYQSEDNVINEMQYDGQNWASSSLNQANAMPGTDMAVVYKDWSEDSNVMFFFQNSDGYLCSVLATNSTWAPVVRLFAAAAVTPIIATWLNNSILLYFQDSTNQFREYRGGFDGDWVLQDSKRPSSNTLGSVAVVSYSEIMSGDTFKVYTQDQDGSLIEWIGSNEAWTPYVSPDFGHPSDDELRTSGTLGTVSALPNVNVSAFAIEWMMSVLIFLYWVDPADRTLRQQVWTQEWLSASSIGDALPTPDPLLSAATWISLGMTVIGLNNETLSAAVQAISDELTADSALHLAAEAAISGINVLAQSVEALSKVSGTSDNCVGQSSAANRRQMAIAAGGWADAGVSIRVFTQNSGYIRETDDNVIHEMKYDGQNWSSSSLKQINPMPGTDMAVVYNDTSDGSYLMLFFQHSDGYLCSVLATNSSWAPAVRIFPAATATPIGATYLSDTVYLYFEDNMKQLQQYRGSFDGGWLVEDFTGQPPSSTRKGKTAAPLLNALRLTKHGRQWINLRLVFLYWVDPNDKILRQRVWNQGWLSEKSIGDPLLTLDALMAKCKGQSVIVAGRFNDLHTKAHTILVDATNSDAAIQLATEITYQQTSIQSQITRVGETQTLAQTKQMAIKQELDTQKKYAAQQKVRDAADDYRTAHEVLSGLAILFPFLATATEFIISPALEDALGVAGKAVDAARTNMASDKQAVDTTQKSYDAIQQEVASFTQLQTTLSAFGPVLESQAATASNMQTCTETVDNNALDVGVFLGKLAGKASVLPFQDTAKILAQTVVAMQKLMKTENQLTGILVDDPQSIDPVLQAIAKSPVVPTAIDEMI
ncbi:hypothetical protein C8J57DRAFT_1575493 [Mycena rebaudengoi]|nr:hypothetical protein C8J57DRAFT_1575493 [Mycena rebaudengoi]